MSKKVCIAASAVALAVSSAFAQSETTGSTNSLYQLATLDPVVVTASKFEEPRGQATVLIDVIHKDEIEESGAISVTELLDRMPGINIIRQYGRLGIDAAIDVGYLGGGSAQRTLIMVDGVRVNDIDDGTVNLGSAPLSAIERIEIRRAGGGVLFGDRALGGVVNIITKPEKKEKTEFHTSLGSFGLKTAGASLSRLAGEGSVHLDVQRANLDGYRRESWQAQTSVLGRVLLPTKVGELGLAFRGSDEDLRLPAAITLATFHSDPRNPGDYRTNSKRDARSGILSLDTQIAPTLKTSVKLLSETLERLSTTNYQTKRNSVLLDATKQYDATLLLFGAEFFDAESKSNRQNRSQVVQTSNAAYLSLERTINESKVMLGTRSQEMRNEFLTTANSVAQTSEERLTSWSLALKHPVFGGVFRGGLQSSFAFPNADQLYTFDSKSPFGPKDIYAGVGPMKSEEVQVGWFRQLPTGSFELSLRRVLIKDEIGFRSNCVGADACNDNLYDTARNVFSTSYSGIASSNTRFLISLDVIDAKIDSGSSKGNRVPMTPSKAIKTSLSHRLLKGTAQVVAHYRDAMYSLDDNSNSGQKIPERALVDFGWSRVFDSNLEVQLWIRNALDKKYYDFATYLDPFSISNGWDGVAPGDGRAFEVSAKYRF